MSSKDALKALYGCQDMLTLIATKKLDFHHIIKECDGGARTVENGALLERESHQWLHRLEIDDPEVYLLINECFQLYKKCMDLELPELIDMYEQEVVPEVKRILCKKIKDPDYRRKLAS